MDNLKLNAEESLLKAAGVAFPEMKIKGYVPGAFLILSLKNINKVGFRNLKTIAAFYNQEVEITTGTNYMTITLSEKESGVEHGD